MDATNQNPVYDDEIRLKDLIRVLARGKWLYASITIGLGVLAAIGSVITPKTYDAAVVVSPVTETPGSGQMGGMGSLISQVGGLASLAGLGGMGGDSKKAESLAVLQSQALTEHYIQQNNLLPELFRNKWDPVKMQWKVADPRKAPTLWKANEFFKAKVRRVTTDTKTGLVTLTITWKDPQVAATWANDLVKETNNFLRKKAIDASERNIAYLNTQAAKTDAVGVKQAIYTILQNEISKAMLARGSEEYALKVIDPALPPEAPSAPQPVVWVFLGVFSGLLLSLLLAFVRLLWIRGME